MNLYKIDKLIGSGGFSRVYLTKNTKSGRVIICKQLTRGDTENEVKTLTTLNGIVTPKLVAYDEKSIYMEFVPGVNLDEFFTKNDDIESKVGALYKVACAMSFIHRCGYAHRDLKLKNVMYDAELRQVKIIDLGSACHYKSKHRAGCGFTTSYVSPEFIKKTIKDYRSMDVFAFASMLSKAYTKKSLFGNTKQLTKKGVEKNIINRDFVELPIKKRAIKLIKNLTLPEAKRPTFDDILDDLLVLESFPVTVAIVGDRYSSMSLKPLIKADLKTLHPDSTVCTTRTKGIERIASKLVRKIHLLLVEFDDFSNCDMIWVYHTDIICSQRSRAIVEDFYQRKASIIYIINDKRRSRFSGNFDDI